MTGIHIKPHITDRCLQNFNLSADGGRCRPVFNADKLRVAAIGQINRVGKVDAFSQHQDRVRVIEENIRVCKRRSVIAKSQGISNHQLPRVVQGNPTRHLVVTVSVRDDEARIRITSLNQKTGGIRIQGSGNRQRRAILHFEPVPRPVGRGFVHRDVARKGHGKVIQHFDSLLVARVIHRDVVRQCPVESELNSRTGIIQRHISGSQTILMVHSKNWIARR